MEKGKETAAILTVDALTDGVLDLEKLMLEPIKSGGQNCRRTMKISDFLGRGVFVLLSMSMSIGAVAQLSLPSVIGDHMVLQQNDSVSVWGRAIPGDSIYVRGTWGTDTGKALTDNYGRWITKIKTPNYGGPYRLEIQSSRGSSVQVEDVLIGEVWLCSGQSNMEWDCRTNFLENKDNIEYPRISGVNNPSIRFFHLKRTGSDYPQEDINANWTVCDSNSIENVSAVGYFFSKKLNDVLGVPVGLVNASWGGSPAEIWTPEAVVKGDTLLSAASEILSPTLTWPTKPGAAFNGMIAPIVDFRIQGAIWYQGESNENNGATYGPLLTTMVKEWRDAWKREFPFFYVGLAPRLGGHRVIVHEQQSKAQMTISNSGMVVISDLVDDVNITHPRNKKDVGDRLANYALADVYNAIGKEYRRYPKYQQSQVEGTKIRIFFPMLKMG